MRIQYNSPVILTYALASLAVVVLNGLTDNWPLMHLFSVYRTSLTDPLAYIRVAGHVLGHVSYEHYFGNILLIIMLGPILEEKYGSKNLAVMILITALVTGVIHMICFNTRLTGGSGIVFMLILLSSYSNVRRGRVPLTLIVSVALFLGREVYNGVVTTNNISYTTHVLGGVCGAAFGFLLNKKGGLEGDTPKGPSADEERPPESGSDT